MQEEEGGPYEDPNIPGMKGPSTKDLFPGPEQIERAKKLHYVLCTKFEDSEASSLHNTLKKQFGGRTAYHSAMTGGDSFYLSLGRNLPQCVNMSNNKVVVDLHQALSPIVR